MASIVAARRGRILVVDDQRANVEMLAELLRSRGYLVDGCYDGESALAKVAEMKPDLVISDIRMPGIDGYELTQRLRGDSATELLPVELVTSLEDRGEYRLYECFIDGTFSKARGGGDGIGCTKAGKGVKIMVLVDARGLPIAVDTTSASPHESQLVQGLLDFMLTDELPERIIGDKAYDSNQLDDELAADGIEMIAPHRRNRRPENVTQDGRPLRRYKRRFTVERTIAWLQHFRRLCIRWEKSTMLFKGYLHLACSIMLLREVLG
jgi:CheY-like chemotaxis protein/transposase